MGRADVLWKGFLEDFFEDCLAFWFPQAVSLFDFSRGVEFLDKELQQIYPETEAEAASTKFVDTLAKVYLTDGAEQWILVLVEVQGQRDPRFAERMFVYFYRLLDRYGKRVTSMVIFTDAGSFHPTSYEYNFLGTSNLFRFNTYKIVDQNEAELSESSNPFAIAALTVKLAQKKLSIDELDLLELGVSLARQLYKRNFKKENIERFFGFLKMYLNFTQADIRLKFDNEISIITQKLDTMRGIEERIVDYLRREAIEEGQSQGIEQGIEQGLEQGINQSKAKFVANLLVNTDFDDAKIAMLADIDEADVAKARLAKAASN